MLRIDNLENDYYSVDTNYYSYEEYNELFCNNVLIDNTGVEYNEAQNETYN
jgi:hypothetical protein